MILDKWIMLIFFIAAIVLFAIPVFRILLCAIKRIWVNLQIGRLRKRQAENPHARVTYDEKLKYVRMKPGVISLLLVFLAIFCMRYAVGCFVSYRAEHPAEFDQTEEEESLGYLEEISNSFVHTLQTFSMDEEYTMYVTEGKKMMAWITEGMEPALTTFSVVLYSAVVSLMNAAAPLAGGAIILDVLMAFMPRLKLWCCSTFQFRKNQYFFSELNDRSLALAKSLYYQYGTRIHLIFTDAYVDQGDEKSSERLSAAQEIGAICIKHDLLNICANDNTRLIYLLRRKLNLSHRTYLLIDEKEIDNLTTLTALVDKKYKRALLGAEVWVFSKDDAYLYVEEQIRGALKEIFKGVKERDVPVVMPINSYRNIISHLFVDVPLYEPIVQKAKKKMEEKELCDLTVTVIGTGEIGMEAILSTYWCGQMENCRLTINVISKEFVGAACEKAFFNKLDAISPEIVRSTDAEDPILRIYPKNKAPEGKETKSPPYATIHYTGTDIKRCPIDELFSYRRADGSTLNDTDYFIVALGSDEDNLLVADILRRYVGNRHLESIEKNTDPKTVIAYAIYDSDLCASLNRRHSYDYSIPEGTDVYMYAFGGLQELYSEKNIFLTDLEPLARRVNDDYRGRQGALARRKAESRRLRDHYSYWAGIARVMHLKYKLFSFGLITESLLDFEDREGERHDAILSEAIERYREMAIAPVGSPDADKKHHMAWLEHRRWNAYMRTKGYRTTALYKTYFYKKISSFDERTQTASVHYHGHDANKRHKYPELKLHPCLVECDREGIKGGVFDALGELDPAFAFARGEDDRADFDCLDVLSYELKRIWDESEMADGSDKGDPPYYDFKLYDYPDGTEKGLK